MYVVNVRTERRRRQNSTAGQLDDVRQGQTQLFTAGTVSVLLQRTAGHFPAAQTATHLRHLHHFTVSISATPSPRLFPLSSRSSSDFSCLMVLNFFLVIFSLFVAFCCPFIIVITFVYRTGLRNCKLVLHKKT